FSSHNIHYKPAFSGPRLGRSWNPIRMSLNVVIYSLSLWNHHRVAPLRETTPEYALLNDPGHFYACLHYYVARSTVRLQLAGVNMRLLEVFDGRARAIEETADDSHSPWLFYVGQRDA